MKLHVAYDTSGKIIGAAEIDPKGAGDKPVARPGMSVEELEVPAEFAGKKLSEYVHHLQVDGGARKLVRKS